MKLYGFPASPNTWKVRAVAHQLGIPLGFLHGIEILTLEIFNESQLEHGSIIGLAQNHRDVSQP